MKFFFFTAAHKILHRGKKKAYIFNLVFSHSTIFPGISYVYCLLVALFPLRHTYSAGHVAYWCQQPTWLGMSHSPMARGAPFPKRFYFGSIPTFPCGAFTLDCLRNQTNPRISCAFFRTTTLRLFLVQPHLRGNTVSAGGGGGPDSRKGLQFVRSEAKLWQ